MAITEREFAARLFEQAFGIEPPKPSPWRIEVHEQDGSLPLYEVDRANRVVKLWLHEGQRRMWESNRRFRFMIAGKQSGKTIIGPVLLFDMILKQGMGDYLAVTATFDLFQLKFLPVLVEFFRDALGIARYHAQDRVLELCDLDTGEFGAEFGYEHEKMHGRIILRSADSQKGLQSATARGALLDEPGLYAPGVWKDIRGRLSLHAGPAVGMTTPYDLGWLKQQIYDPWATNTTDEIDVIQFSSNLSPFFSEAEYESLRASMQPWEFRMDYDAEFGRPPAAIYEDYQDVLREQGGHLVKRFVIPQEWPRMVAIDPGVVNPGKIWAAYDAKEDVYFIYRAEKGGERRTSVEHGQYDVERAQKGNERVIWWAVGAKSEKYWREDYRKAGAKGVREPDTADVEEGIDRMAQLIRQHRIYIMDDLADLRDEFLRYSREIKNGEVTRNIKDKATYHLMDAGRYFAVQVVKPRQAMRMTVETGRYA